MVDRFPNSIPAMELLARTYEKFGDNQALEAAVVAMTERFPGETRFQGGLGRLHLNLSEFDSARNIAIRLIAADEALTQADGYLLSGDVGIVQEMFTEALRDYRKVHELNPTTRSVLKIHAVEQKIDAENTSVLDAWLTEHVDDVPVRIALAMSNYAAGRHAQAIAHYGEVLERSPKNLVALNNLAWMYGESSDERALEYGRRSCADEGRSNRHLWLDLVAQGRP